MELEVVLRRFESPDVLKMSGAETAIADHKAFAPMTLCGEPVPFPIVFPEHIGTFLSPVGRLDLDILSTS